jgi:hypothetical protein
MTLMPARGGAVFCCATGLTACVKMGSSGAGLTPGTTRPELDSVIVDGCNLPTHAVQTTARRAMLINAQVWRGTSTALRMDGQNSRARDCIVGQNLVGYGVTMNAADCKMYGGEIRECGTAQMLMNAFGGLEVSEVHMYGGLGPNIEVRPPTGNAGPIKITNNMLEDTTGHKIWINVTSSASGAIEIEGNTSYQLNALTSDLYSFVRVDLAAATFLRGLNVIGNTYKHFISTSGYLRAIVEASGAGAPAGMVGTNVTGNTFQNCLDVARGFVPMVQKANVVAASTSTYMPGDGAGTATFSGDGTTTAFVIPHGCWKSPSRTPIVVATAASTAAKGDFYVSAVDATNITITYGTAPVSGSNNVVLNWMYQA